MNPQTTIANLGTEAGSAALLEAVLDAMPAGVLVLDGQGVVVRANPAAQELLGAALVGRPWREVIEAAFAPRPDDGQDISLRDGRYVSLATQALGDRPGQLLLLRDVTDRRRLQARLDHHQRLATLGQMAASLAHQIRTPLSAALLYASNLEREGLAEVDRRRFAAKIVRNLDHLEGVIRHMLLFARGEQSAREPVNGRRLLAAAARAARGYVGGCGARLRIAEASRLELSVQGQPDALLSALQNIIRNAAEAAGAGGRVDLALRQAGADSLDLQISDTGPGLDAKQREQVFEPFYTTRPGGTGLGLAVARAVARAHGGALWVDAAPGGGCCFVLRLPLAGAAEHRGAA